MCAVERNTTDVAKVNLCCWARTNVCRWNSTDVCCWPRKDADWWHIQMGLSTVSAADIYLVTCLHRRHPTWHRPGTSSRSISCLNLYWQRPESTLTFASEISNARCHEERSCFLEVQCWINLIVPVDFEGLLLQDAAKDCIHKSSKKYWNKLM